MISEPMLAKIKSGFSKSLKPGRLHFAAHSHHPWPDATEAAALQYWSDSAEYLDSKWSLVFGKVIKESRHNLGRLMNIKRTEHFIEGGSTLELVSRVLSAFDLSRPIRILTTDSEFYSFERMARRLEESPLVEVIRVSTQPFDSFETRFQNEIRRTNFDIIFSSLVFYNSGFYADRLLEVLSEAANETTILVDVYHALGAIPVNFADYCQKIFFVGGGYKYLSAGEGACFLFVPENTKLRPVTTGWLADYGSLNEGLSKKVNYSRDGARFAGATYDPSGWYRFNAVQEWWKEIGLNVDKIHSHVQDLQKYFMDRMLQKKSDRFSDNNLIIDRSRINWGHFLSYKMTDAEAVEKSLRAKDIFVDSRANILRIGFGYYQSTSDVDRLVDQLFRI